MTEDKDPKTDGRVLVVYKNGATVEVRSKNFVVRKMNGAIVEIEWDKANPRPLHIGIDEIAAVWSYDD